MTDQFDADYEPSSALAAPEKVEPVTIDIPPAYVEPRQATWIVVLRWVAVFPAWLVTYCGVALVVRHINAEYLGDFGPWAAVAFGNLVGASAATYAAAKTAPSRRMAVCAVAIAVHILILGLMIALALQVKDVSLVISGVAAVIGACAALMTVREDL